MKVLMPEHWRDAVALKAEHADAIPIAGGTDLLVCWAEDVDRHDHTYLDLSGVADARSMTWEHDALRFGALTTYWDFLSDDRACGALPLLGAAAREVGAVQIQTRGTWAGNVANASPAADGVAAMMACDAVVRLISRRGSREVSLERFFLGYKKLDMARDELIESIAVPIRARRSPLFFKVGARRAQAISKTGVAMAHSTSGWRVVAISMGPTTCRCPSIESLLDAGTPLSHASELLSSVEHDVTPIDDIRSTAAYRREVFCRVVFDAVQRARKTGG